MQVLYHLDSITAANLSNRATNLLKRTGIETIADLVGYDREGFAEIKNAGVKTVKEISAFLDALDGGVAYRLAAADALRPREDERAPMTAAQYAQTVRQENHRAILLKRLQGLKLDEISAVSGITRERVRQILEIYLRDKPPLAEDKFREVYEKYALTQEDFCFCFGEGENVYRYLMLAYKRGDLPLARMLTDESVPAEAKQKAEQIVYRQYITVGGERLYKRRAELAEYIIRTHFQNEGAYSDFLALYRKLLADFNLSDEPRLTLNTRYYENALADHRKVLWKQNKRLRYYDISRYDFTELLQTLNLGQYKDEEYSTRKFFHAYPALMRRYDVRDEYELHNLLKKIVNKNENKDMPIHFPRMPMIIFGKGSRHEQILAMMTELAPISAHELAIAYEKKYGVYAATFQGSFLKNFEEYVYNGVCDMSAQTLPDDQQAYMAEALTADYYEIETVQRIYRNKFPGEPTGNINQYTLKQLGFYVYSTYIIKKTYAGATDYFRVILTKEDRVDARPFPRGLRRKTAYTSQLGALKDTYEIIEYEPYRYMNIRLLTHMGISAEQLSEYCEAVWRQVSMDEYFTIFSLRRRGFSHPLDALAFSEMFYSSLLSVHRRRFSCRRIGRTKVFCVGNRVTLSGFITALVEREEAITLPDFMALLTKQYGVFLPRHKVVTTIANSPMHHDLDTDTLYIGRFTP